MTNSGIITNNENCHFTKIVLKRNLSQCLAILSNVKKNGRFFQNFVAFSGYMNFKYNNRYHLKAFENEISELPWVSILSGQQNLMKT